MSITIEFNSNIRRYLKDISSSTDNEYISLIFEGKNLYILGYTTYYYEIMKFEINENIIGAYRMHADNLRIISLYDSIELNILEDKIAIFCFDKSKKQCAMSIPKEKQIDYNSTKIIKDIQRLAKPKVYDIDLLRDYLKVLKLIDDGVAFNAGYAYGEGEGFKVYGLIDKGLNFAISKEVLKKIVNMLGNSIVTYDLGNVLLSVKNDGFYFGFKKFKVDKTWSLKFLQLFNLESKVEISRGFLNLLKGIADKDAKITISPAKNAFILRSRNINMLFAINFESKELLGKNPDIVLGLNTFKQIITCLDTDKITLENYGKCTLVHLGRLIFVVRNIEV